MAASIREAIRDRALAAGFDAVGFAEARLDRAARAGLEEFLARGYHGDMGWLAGTAARRGDPGTLWPEAKSVVVLGVNYAPADDPSAQALRRDCGVVSVYARGRDYHDTLKRRLRMLAQWIEAQWPGALKLFVDTAPVMEKAAGGARRARLAGQAHQSRVAGFRLLAVSR
jgi:epoxyqueuosine reductase